MIHPFHTSTGPPVNRHWQSSWQVDTRTRVDEYVGKWMELWYISIPAEKGTCSHTQYYTHGKIHRLIHYHPSVRLSMYTFTYHPFIQRSPGGCTWVRSICWVLFRGNDCDCYHHQAPRNIITWCAETIHVRDAPDDAIEMSWWGCSERCTCIHSIRCTVWMREVACVLLILGQVYYVTTDIQRPLFSSTPLFFLGGGGQPGHQHVHFIPSSTTQTINASYK